MDRVLLVHGLWMSGYACLYWRRVMREAEFLPYVFSYPSVFHHLNQNADRLFRAVVRASAGGHVVHLVGHSLGGLVILQMLRRHGHLLPNVHRVVLCGSPVNGSFCARQGARVPVLAQALGHTILEWEGIERSEVPEWLDVGVLAGTRAMGLGKVFPELPSPSDGTVALSEALWAGADDRMVMHLNHSEMLFAPAAGVQIVHFIRHGTFLHGVGRKRGVGAVGFED